MREKKRRNRRKIEEEREKEKEEMEKVEEMEKEEVEEKQKGEKEEEEQKRDSGSGDGGSGDVAAGVGVSAPSYEECTTGGEVDIREEDDNEYLCGELKWRPRYPMYRQLSEPQGPSTSALAPSQVDVDNIDVTLQ